MYRERNFSREKSFAPVNVGDIVEVKIEAVGEKGDGIAKIKGFVIFVPNGKKDETVKVKITRVLRKVGFAEIVGSGAESSEGSESEEPAEEESYEETEDNNSEEDSENF